MSTQSLRAPSMLAVLFCAGCVVSPPPPLMPLPPAADVAPPAQAAAAPQEQAAQAGPTCREFKETITLNGAPQEAWGTTCLQPDGTWKVMASPQLDGAPSTTATAAAATTAPPPAPPPQQQQQQAVAVPSYPAYSYYSYPYPYPYYYYPPYYYGGPVGGAVFARGRWR